MCTGRHGLKAVPYSRRQLARKAARFGKRASVRGPGWDDLYEVPEQSAKAIAGGLVQ